MVGRRFCQNRLIVVPAIGLILLAIALIVALDTGESVAQLPPDGAQLYRVLLKEIPEVVSEIPCACCGESLAWCYRGGCPST